MKIEDLEPVEDTNDKIRNIMLMSGVESPVIVPFEGFRERLQAEEEARHHVPKDSIINYDKEKKSLNANNNQEKPVNELPDEERLLAHFRKYKIKPPPFTAEYLTANRFSPLDEEIRSNALEKYKQSFLEKNFPFEYENPEDISEARSYVETPPSELNGDEGTTNEKGGYIILQLYIILKHFRNLVYFKLF